MANKSNRRDIIVGFFVLFCILVFSIFIFLIGSQQRLFAPRYEIKAVYDKVAGLKEGAEVRLAGIRVGTVKAVEFSYESRVIVTLEIMKEYQSRIREDSVARIVQTGVLGDYLIEISPGDRTHKALEPEDFVKTDEYKDLNDLIQATKPTLESLENTLKNLSDLSERLNNPEGEFLKTVSNIQEITWKVKEGQGTLGKLLEDEAAYEDLKGFIEDGKRAAANVEEITGDIKGFTKELPLFTEKGKEILRKAEKVVDKADKAAANVEQASEELPELMISGQSALEESQLMLEEIRQHPVYMKYITPGANRGLVTPRRLEPVP